MQDEKGVLPVREEFGAVDIHDISDQHHGNSEQGALVGVEAVILVVDENNRLDLSASASLLAPGFMPAGRNSLLTRLPVRKIPMALPACHAIVLIHL